MEKILVRDFYYLVGRDYGQERNIFLEDDDDKNEIIETFGYKAIMREIYGEPIDEVDLKNTGLYQYYEQARDTGEDNEHFIFMYKLDKNFAVRLTCHIDLYRLAFEEGSIYSKLVPWWCVENSIYIGDTWNATDDEILEDIQRMNVLDFFREYKGV